MSRATPSRTRIKLNPFKIFRFLTLSAITILGFYVLTAKLQKQTNLITFFNNYEPQPLVMTGGDPYIRALMRTITASEANVERPYNVLYGGQYVSDLTKHPEECVPIVTGPNVGNCTTAAGRYQFLNTTWYEKAKQYHPHPSGFFWWKSYSFEPEYQDRVIYAWLSDPQAWGVNISQLLKEGKVQEVLRLLSGTWTSLGYGIETNSMSPKLPKIYEEMLQEELGHTEFTGTTPEQRQKGQEFLLKLSQGQTTTLDNNILKRLLRYHLIEESESNYDFEVPLIQMWVKKRTSL